MTASDPAHKKRRLRPASVQRAFLELVRPRKGLLGVGLLLILINRAADLVIPAASKYLIDEVVQKRNLALLTPIASVAAAAVLAGVASGFLLTQLLSKSAQHLIAELRIKVQQHVGRLPLRYYDANKTGALLSRIMSDVEGVRNLIGTGIVELLGGILTAIAAFGLLLAINAKLTFAVLLFLVMFSVIHAEVSGRLAESLGGVRVIKGFNAERREAATFSGGAMRLYENVKKTLTATSLTLVVAKLVIGIVSLIVMVVGGRMIVAGTMTMGDFVAFTLYLAMLVAPMFQIVNIGSQLTEAFAGLDRTHEVLSETPEDVDPQRTRMMEIIRGEVRFEDVWFEYDTGKPVLRGVSLEAKPGTVTALVGSSGSGKSTLISLVAAFAKPTRGTVFVDGIDLAAVRLDSYRSKLGVVLQDNFLFDGSLQENLLFGRPEATQEEVMKAAEIARVDEFALTLEKGYGTIIGERGVKLSGGQRQRMAIARAILANPRILILDEATSSLDSESEAMIQQGLAALVTGRTTFVIAHRLSTIRSSDQILVLEGGVIVERGRHDELLEFGGRYFELYTRQAGIEGNRFLNPGEKERAAEDRRRLDEQEEKEPLSPLQLLRGKEM
jgi:subfamily B ATP-binding cassette protein MsbA